MGIGSPTPFARKTRRRMQARAPPPTPVVQGQPVDTSAVMSGYDKEVQDLRLQLKAHMDVHVKGKGTFDSKMGRVVDGEVALEKCVRLLCAA